MLNSHIRLEAFLFPALGARLCETEKAVLNVQESGSGHFKNKVVLKALKLQTALQEG